MFTYDEITRIVTDELRGERILETSLLSAVLSGNPEQHHETVLKIVALGHEYGGRSTGRPMDEKHGRVVFLPKDIEQIGKDYSAVHVQILSLSYSIFVQSPIRDIQTICRESVCMLFEIGYKIGCREITEDDSEIAPAMPELPLEVTLEDDDDVASFLRSLV